MMYSGNRGLFDASLILSRLNKTISFRGQTRLKMPAPNEMISVSAGIAECRVELRQISFGLLPPTGRAGATWSLGIQL